MMDVRLELEAAIREESRRPAPGDSGGRDKAQRQSGRLSKAYPKNAAFGKV